MAWRGFVVAMIIIAACLIVIRYTADCLVDWLWFSDVRYPDVFWTILGAKVALFLAVFAASAILLWLNGSLAYRLAERQRHLPAVVSPWRSIGDQTLTALLARLSQRLPWRFLVAGGALVLAALVALGETDNWDVALRFIRQAPYGQSDPLYGKDIGFYLFSLPAYVALKNWMLLTLALCALVAGAVYWAHRRPYAREASSGDSLGHRPRLRPVGPLLRGEGLVLLARPVPPPLRRQCGGRGGGIHGRPCRAAGALGARRHCLSGRLRLMGQYVGAIVQASRGRGGSGFRRLVRASAGSSRRYSNESM